MTSTPIAEMLQARDLCLLSTGTPLGAFNIGIVKPSGDDPDRAIDYIESYFTSRDLPYRIQLRDDQVEALEPKLREKGYAEVLPTPSMVLIKIPAAPALPDGLEIESVKGCGGLPETRHGRGHYVGGRYGREASRSDIRELASLHNGPTRLRTNGLRNDFNLSPIYFAGV